MMYMAPNLGAEMPRQFRLALAQINSTVGDISGNTQTILKYIDMAREAKAD